MSLFRLTAPRCPGKAAGAVSLRKTHDIVILSFCNIVKGQAIYMLLTPNCVRLRNFELVTNVIRVKTSSSPYSYNSIDIDHVKHCSTCFKQLALYY